jgi:hypothetical protein
MVQVCQGEYAGMVHVGNKFLLVAVTRKAL